MSAYLEKRRAIMLGLQAPDPKKEPKPLQKVGEKKKAKDAAAKTARGGEDTFKEKWFQARRKTLTGTCQCGCGQPSQKNDDMYFRHCCCHVFPKSEESGFPSIALHPMNCVERRFWGGCHTNMDEAGMDKWVNFADWPDIKERFHVLAPLLTEEERKRKFYTRFEALVYAN